MISVTKIFEFEAAHQLPDEECYGNCRKLHGHTYKLEVSVKGNINEKGWILNFKDLKAIVNEHIISKFDHSHLNAFFTISTAEVMGQWIYNTIEHVLPMDVHMNYIRLWETSTSSATIHEYNDVSFYEVVE